MIKRLPQPLKRRRWFAYVALLIQTDECISWPFQTSMVSKKKPITIKINGREPTASRYVCELAHGAPPTPRHECAHNCGNGHLSCVNPRHLRWATTRDNQLDRFAHGTHSRGERNGQAKLTEDDVRDIRRMLATGQSPMDIARCFNVSPASIYLIRKKKNWAWLA